MGDDSLLREQTDRGVRLVALSLLAHARKAGNALIEAQTDDRDADEALHDFRVAVRRLRSWIRTFKSSLRDDLSGKRRRRLSGIGDATNMARDATVHLEWVRGERSTLTAGQRSGQAWLSKRLDAQRTEGRESALAAARQFEKMIPKLTRRLCEYRAEVLADESGSRFGVLLADRLLAEADSLREHLAGIHQSTDVDGVHRARIAAKRLRYVVEPVSQVAEDGDAIIDDLKTLQDSLGDLHDVHVFSEELVVAAEEAAATQARRVSEVVLDATAGGEGEKRIRSRDPGPGLLHLARRLRERAANAYVEVEKTWLNDAGAVFFERARDFAAEIRRRASLGREIERKYLLERVPDEALEAPSVEIEQGYLPGELLVERIRCTRSPDGTERWARAVKAGSGIARVELEEEADAELCRALWPLTDGRRVHKRRYMLRESNDVVWEVDQFLDRTLVVAEIELPAPDAKVELPPWLRAVLNREVTEEPEFANVRLAR